MSITTTNETLEDFGLGGVDCPKCGNMGYIPYTKDGEIYSRECECMNTRRSMRRIKNSGMIDLLSRYTFAEYETPDDTRAKIKAAAQKYAEADDGWFYIAGQSGSGKTHICTAICSRLMERGKEVYYMKWRDESRQLKAIVNTEDIDPKLEKLKSVPVLYIDDFLKGGANEADIRLAFEILNARYNESKARTVLSSEIGIKELLRVDEAVGSRVYERSRGYRLSAPSENWRLR